MIAEENLEIAIVPPKNTNITKGSVIKAIIKLMTETVPHFLSALLTSNITNPLNENKLTQVYVEQVGVLIRKYNLPFNVQNQYNDLFFGTKGIPDFYFHSLEQGKTTTPIFVVEAKRLPAPSKEREREYVIGNSKENGGLERFKNQKQGKGLNQLGLLGFIEDKTYQEWLETINEWIIELSLKNKDWNSNEALIQNLLLSDYSYLTSSTLTKNSTLAIHHIWIKTN